MAILLQNLDLVNGLATRFVVVFLWVLGGGGGERMKEFGGFGN